MVREWYGNGTETRKRHDGQQASCFYGGDEDRFLRHDLHCPFCLTTLLTGIPITMANVVSGMIDEIQEPIQTLIFFSGIVRPL